MRLPRSRGVVAVTAVGAGGACAVDGRGIEILGVVASDSLGCEIMKLFTPFLRKLGGAAGSI